MKNKQGNLEFAFVDKTGTLTTNEYKVSEIMVRHKLYQINPQPIFKEFG